MKNRSKFIANICIVLGICLILITLAYNLKAYTANKDAVEDYKKYYSAEQGKTVPDETRYKDEDGIDTDSGELQYPDGAVGILQIPRIDSEEIIMEGSDRSTLAGALGHLEGTAFPGKIGNFVVAGHRNYNFGQFFNRLDEVEKDDKLYVECENKVYTYQVNEILVVEPEDLSVLNDTGEQTITLITCTPLYIGTHRLIVKGILVDIGEITGNKAEY